MTNAPQTAVKTKRCIIWNANSIGNKKLDLERFINEVKPAIVPLCKTNIKLEQKPLRFKNYRTISSPASKTRRRLALLIHISINFTSIEINTNSMETLAAKVDDI